MLDQPRLDADNEFPAWPYRDYVLNAFRDNKPFDDFTREQLAGDLIPNATLEQRTASAYNRIHRVSSEGGIQDKEYLAKYGADRVRTTSAVWLGITTGCAECHDHKFDPILTKDFYSMKAVFADLEENGIVGTSGPKGHGTKMMLPGGKVYAHQDFSSIDTEWKRFEFDFPVEVEDPQARFTVQINGRGIVWVDQVSLMPGSAVDNLRADVVERIRELRPAFIRWPGDNVGQDYHWIWGVGPRDRRPAWVNMSWDEDPEPSDFGTLEYLAFCEAIGAEPNMVVNVEGRGVTVAEAAALRAEGRDIYSESRQATDQEAAGWVEYVNGPATSKYGALRAKHGHPEPFGVKYWEIGNEIWGDWVRDYSDAATYVVNARRYVRAMKAVDPSIKIIAVGHNDMEWNRTVLREIGDEIDMISIHHYYGQDDSPAGRANLMLKPLWFEKFYGRVGELIRELQPDRKITLAINEWATTLPLPRQNTMQAALYGARLMNAFERKGDLIEMSAISDLVNGWPGGVIQASRRRLFTTPNYAVIRAYNEHRGAWRLGADTEVSVLHQPTDPELGKDIPALDVVASISEDGKEIQLKVVNTSMDTDIPTEIKIEGSKGSIASEAQVVTIRGASLEAANSFREPDAITARQRTVASTGDRFSFSFAKHSVNVIVLQVGTR